MTRLGPLFTKYGTDKGTNGYTGLYECLFAERRHRVVSLLEIGIGTMLPGVSSSMKGYMPDSYQPGSSLRAWRDYFPNATIYGIDPQPDTQFSDVRIETALCNSLDKNQIDAALDKFGRTTFDIIIDDGCHDTAVQIGTFANFFRYVAPLGIYVVEDVWPPPRTAQLVEGLNPARGNSPVCIANVQFNQVVVHKI